MDTETNANSIGRDLEAARWERDHAPTGIGLRIFAACAGAGIGLAVVLGGAVVGALLRLDLLAIVSIGFGLVLTPLLSIVGFIMLGPYQQRAERRRAELSAQVRDLEQRLSRAAQ